MAKDDLSIQLNKLKEKKIPIWSISRLNTYDGCEWEYYLNYILGNKGKDSVYGTMGNIVHDSLDDLHNDKKTELDMLTNYLAGLHKCQLFGLDFPEEYIKKAWKTDMNHFVHNFKKLDGEHMTEHGFIYELDGNVFTGFIDEIRKKDNEITIIDWKTSSEFKDEKLESAGRQLLLYKLAYEQEFGVKVDKIGWMMLKYIYVHYDGKTKMVARRNAVKDIKALINTQLKKLGYSESDRDLLITEAMNDNNLECMPKEVKNRFKYEDCLLYYDVTEERIQELKDYVKNTIDGIQSKKDESDWLPKDDIRKIIKKKSGEEFEEIDFYCKNLCGHKNICKWFQLG